MTADAAAPATLAGQAPPEQAPAQKSLRVLQRVVFPGDDLDVLPLYAETNLDRGAAELSADLLTGQIGKKKADTALSTTPPVVSAAVGNAQSSIRFGSALPTGLAGQVDPRRSATIAAGHRVSFATYFNAFPASYWRRWTTVKSVVLRIRVAGEATIFLYRSSAKGHSHSVETIEVTTSAPTTIERTLTLTPFIDGGWYWFDILAGHGDTTLIEAEWLTLTEPTAPGRASIAITTINRTDFMLNQLRTLGGATAVLELLDKIYVVDQGTDKLAEHPDFADAAKATGDKLRVIEQGNLGGSGGFSRGMAETLKAGESDYVLILDDDISLDPEGILRGLAFADLARRPTIVGGHMFSLYDRSVLHAMGETVAPYRWWWGPAPHTSHRHDFGRRNLRNTPWLHRRVDVDYNGWWMCLIPTAVIREAGLALPVFIKWDDAEYGFRARKHGFPTVSLPGMAAWHVPWQDKTDAQDWQAYYHLRNRIVSALLHSPYERGGSLVNESAEIQVQHLLSMQYSTAALRLLAIEDVLTGPQHLHRDLQSKLGELRDLRMQFSDAQARPDVESFPPVRQRKPPARGRQFTSPNNKLGLITMAGKAAAKQLIGPKKGTKPRPQAALSYQDASWWVLSNLDSALVSAADGASTAWYKRDPRKFRELTLRTVFLHARLARQWPKLSAQYRAAMPEFTSPEAWQETFEASVDAPPPGAVSSVPARQRGKSAAPAADDATAGSAGPADPVAAPAGPPGGPAGTRAGWAAAARYGPIVAAAAAMLVAGLWGLARDSAMGNDEVATRWAARLSLHQLAHLLRHVDAVHGLYYVLMHGWMAVGTSPTVMRIPSVIAMIAAVVMTVILARQLTGSAWPGLFAGVIIALTPSITYYAQTARSYALVYACVLGATLVLLHALRAEAAGAPGARLARRWLAYGALITVAGYLNELSLLILGAHLVTVLLARYPWRTIARWAVAGAAGAVLVVPLAILSAREDGAVAWIPRPGPADLRILFHDYFGAGLVVAILLAACAIVAMLPGGRLTGLGYWWRRRTDAAAPATPGGGISLASVAAPLLIVPAALLIVESLVAHPLYVDRYVLYGEAGAALLAGAGIYRAGHWLADVVASPTARRSLILLPGIVVCVLALVLQLGALQRVRTPGSRLFNFGGPSQFVSAHARPGDGVLFFTAFYRKAELGYPGDFRQVSDFAVAVTPAQAGTFQGIDKPAAEVRPLLLSYQRVWVVGRPPAAHLAGPFGVESRALTRNFSLATERHYRGIVVTLWIRH